MFRELTSDPRKYMKTLGKMYNNPLQARTPIHMLNKYADLTIVQIPFKGIQNNSIMFFYFAGNIVLPRETETEEFVGFDGKPDVLLENPRFSGTTRFFQNRSKSAFSFFHRSPHRYCKRKVIWTNSVLVCVPGLRNNLEPSV